MFGLVDCNNFFASCERVFNPKLEGQPIVVLSNNDGCIIARSNEAKALGIPMGAPLHEYKKLCQQHGVHIFSSNYALYADMSRRVMGLLQAELPQVEIYSVDEAFLSLQGFPVSALVPLMQRLRAHILQCTGITVSMGIAPTKALAKVANKQAKKLPHGVHALVTEASQRAALATTPVADVWGVGRRLAPQLTALGLTTALDLRHANPTTLRRQFNVVLERLVYELRGHSCLPLALVKPEQRSIQSTRSFGRPVTSLPDLEEAMATYTTRAACQLRQQGLLAQMLLVYVTTNRFKPHTPQYRNSHTLGLAYPTADTQVLIQHAHAALRAIYQPGYAYKKAGVMLLELVPLRHYQPSLFGQSDTPATLRLMATLDALNRRFGKQHVRFASTGLKQTWQMRSAGRSPQYSTHWHELLQVC